MDEDASSPSNSGGDAGGRRDYHSIEITEGEQPSEVVVRAVSAVTNTPPLELDPLYGVVDPGALDTIFRMREGSPDAEMTFRFDFNGCEVVLRNRSVSVRELDE